MGKIVSDLSGDLRKLVFYRFIVWCSDEVLDGKPTPEWILSWRTPTNTALVNADQPFYVALEDYPKEEDRVEKKDCPANPNHVTSRYYKSLQAELVYGTRLSSIVPTLNMRFIAVSEELRARLEALKVKGARLDPIQIDDEFHELKNLKLWMLQFTGRARVRPPKFVNTPNLCPQCGQGKIVCESCGHWIPRCENCGQQMHIREDVHKGSSDKRVPVEYGLKTVIEGKTWDGSDLMGGGNFGFASKRFIDWLLRIHAAPFYAEPVYFCVDGMSDQQKQWLDDLQKPFHV